MILQSADLIRRYPVGFVFLVLWLTFVMVHIPYLACWAQDGKPFLAYTERWKKILSNQNVD